MSEFGEGARRLSGAAAQLLGWRPGDFWLATPAELAAALGDIAGHGEPPKRDEMDALMARFPDRRD